MRQRTFLVIFLFVFAFSCNFKPIYKEDNRFFDDYVYQQELAAIKIKISRKKLNYDLKNNLEKVLNPNDIKVNIKYLLTITLNRTLSSTFTNYTGSSGRNKVILSVNYRLEDLEGGIISTGSTIADDDFDVERKRFADYVTENSIATNITLVVAQNIRNLLINDIIDNYRKTLEEDLKDDSKDKLVNDNQRDGLEESEVKNNRKK